MSEGHGETSEMSVRASLKVAQRPLALVSVAPGDTSRAQSRLQCSWKGKFMAGPLQHPLCKASCNVHLKQIREKEGSPRQEAAVKYLGKAEKRALPDQGVYK